VRFLITGQDKIFSNVLSSLFITLLQFYDISCEIMQLMRLRGVAIKWRDYFLNKYCTNNNILGKYFVDIFYVQYSVHHGSIYQEITNRCHVTLLYFLLILYMFRTHSVSIIRRCGRPHDTVTVLEVAYAVNFIDLLMMDTECVRNM
jgi:hypothetical protein